MIDEMSGIGCVMVIIIFVMVFIIQPAAFGGVVNSMFGIDNMDYWTKWVGGLSGLGLPLWFACYAIKQCVPTPFFQVELLN